MWGWGWWRLALRRTPTNVEDQQYRERERGVLGGLEKVCVCVGGGRRRRVISAFRFYFLQIDISEVMIIYLHLGSFCIASIVMLTVGIHHKILLSQSKVKPSNQLVDL